MGLKKSYKMALVYSLIVTPIQLGIIPFAFGATASNSNLVANYECSNKMPSDGNVPNCSTPGVLPCNAPAGFTKIYDSTGLNNVRNNLQGNYFLCNDIVLSGLWQPIGAGIGPAFSGVFDGNNKKVSGLSIYPYPSVVGEEIGLFGEVYGLIKNLSIQSPSITYGYSNIGTLVGRNSGTIQNCFVTGTGTISGNLNPTRVGGLVGYNAGGTIQNSAVIGTDITVSGYQGVGGLVGYTQGTFQDDVVNSSSNAEVTVSYYAGGGLAGYAVDGSRIVNSHATGNVTGTSSNGGVNGGLVGNLAYSSKIIRSYATGNVSSIVGMVGGLVGYVFNTSSIENSYATGDVHSNGTAGGLVGQLWGYDSLHPATVTRSYASGNASGASNSSHGPRGGWKFLGQSGVSHCLVL